VLGSPQGTTVLAVPDRSAWAAAGVAVGGPPGASTGRKRKAEVGPTPPQTTK